jgi:hypothetical protein
VLTALEFIGGGVRTNPPFRLQRTIASPTGKAIGRNLASLTPHGQPSSSPVALSRCHIIKDSISFPFNNTELLDWPRASVVCYCVARGIELFLKAGIAAKSASDQQSHHRIGELFARYTELYPTPDFHFPQPWTSDEEDLETLLGAKILDDVDKKKDQVSRYMAGKDGQPPKGTYYFGPFTWLEGINDLESNWQRIWPKIIAEIDA